MKNKGFIKILIFLLFVSFTSFGCIGLEGYKEKYKEEDYKIFGTYNKNYEKKVDDNSGLIILEIDSSEAEIANVAIVNYISNVGGELVSLNDLQISNSSIKPGFIATLSGEGPKLGLGLLGGQKIDNKIRYTLSVPANAKFIDNLQERLNRYLWYYPWIKLTS